MSSVIKKQKFCRACNKNVLAERQTGMSDGMGCLLTIITLGLFAPIFLLLRFINALGGYHCPQCGSRIMFGGRKT